MLVYVIQYRPDEDMPYLYNADGILQFPPNGFEGMRKEIPQPKLIREASPQHLILDYGSLAEENRELTYRCDVIRTSFPSWDSSARKKSSWACFEGASPEKFRNWLIDNVFSQRFDNNLKITAVNAWNEWAEGACLEPDRRYGFSTLEAVRDARLYVGLKTKSYGWTKMKSRCIVAHIFYDEAVERVCETIEPYSDSCDIYITTHAEGLAYRSSKIFSLIPNARVFVEENRGHGDSKRRELRF